MYMRFMSTHRHGATLPNAIGETQEVLCLPQSGTKFIFVEGKEEGRWEERRQDVVPIFQEFTTVAGETLQTNTKNNYVPN